MTKNIDTINAAVALIVKATILAASFSVRVRKRSLKRLSRMDVDSKDKEIIFLRDKVIQLKTQAIAVIERVHKTLKYEWLKRVAIIKDFDHLTELCKDFETWYNSWRPHMTLDGFRPDDVYYDRKPEKPKRNAKTVPCNIEQCFFRETRITGYRLKKAA